MPSAFIARDRFAASLELLLAEHRTWIVERRLQHRQHVERVGRRVLLEQVEDRERERRERLVQREVRLQVDGERDRAVRRLLHDLGGAQRAVDGKRAPERARAAASTARGCRR